MSEDPAVLTRALERERKRRAHAESLLEEKSRELFHSYGELEKAHKELKKNQKQLVQTEKMASLGIMSAGVAHEINNPIGFVLSNLRTLGEYAPVFGTVYQKLKQLLEGIDAAGPLGDQRKRIEDYLDEEDLDFLVEDTGDLLTESTEGVIRVRDIVAGLKSFSHADTEAQQAFDLNDTISKTLSLAANQIKSTCELKANLGDVPQLHGNPGRIGQVVMNLVVNATQAVPADGGVVCVRTHVTADEAILEVTDNGHGMSEETKEKLFTPFFTTKAVGEGTGLGLSISFGIVEEHGGRMEVTSSEGEGATFTVALPLPTSANAVSAG